MSDPWYLKRTYADITLEAMGPEHAAELLDGVVSSLDHLKPWMPWAKDDYSQTDAEEACQKFATQRENGTAFTFGIYWQGKLSGVVSFMKQAGEPELGDIELGAWLRKDASGKGLGKKMLNAMLEWAFDERITDPDSANEKPEDSPQGWGFRSVYWLHNPDNIASKSLAASVGMIPLSEQVTITIDGFGTFTFSGFRLTKKQYRALVADSRIAQK